MRTTRRGLARGRSFGTPTAVASSASDSGTSRTPVSSADSSSTTDRKSGMVKKTPACRKNWKPNIVRPPVSWALAKSAGWTSVAIEPLDVECTLPKHELDDYIVRVGPLARALHDADERARTRIVDAVRAAFEPYIRGAEIRFTAACWTVGARAASLAAGGKND